MNAVEGRRARPSDPWLAPVHVSVECDLWGGYIDLGTRGKPLPKEGIAKIEREVNDFHSERMNSPPQTYSLKYWAKASLKYPIVAQAAQNYPCIPASTAVLELLKSEAHSWSKTGDIVRGARERALLFVMEPGLDVLGVNSLKICKKTELFGLWRICKKCYNILFFK